MERYGLRGTPSSVLIGRDGRIVHHGFGQEDDMAMGALIASALGQTVEAPIETGVSGAGCTPS